MKSQTTKTLMCILAILAMTALAFSGCARKHIVSSPPAQKPATGVEPAPKPAVVEEAPVVLEDNYVVDAPDEEQPPRAKVEEGSLDDEPIPAPTPTEAAAPITAPEVAPATAPAAAPAAAVATETEAVPMGDMYYVQVGAFSDMENANKVLAGLISDGYAGSKLATTSSGLYRVQAGTFPDKAAAEAALMVLKTEYPKGYILK